MPTTSFRTDTPFHSGLGDFSYESLGLRLSVGVSKASLLIVDHVQNSLGE